jgi:hypothetical protein
MQTTRKKLLVTLVLMTVAVASVWPTLASAGVSSIPIRGSSDGPVARPNGNDTAGEPDTPGNSGPTPTIVVVHLTSQPGHGDPHSRMVPMNVLFMWIGRIWAAQYGMTP